MGSNPFTATSFMVCTKCKQDCVGFPTGNPEDDMCMDCAFPMLKEASDSAVEAVAIGHWRRTGEFVDGRTLMRRAIGIE